MADEDQIMEEEQELKQLVKNVAKKLTYEDEDKLSSYSGSNNSRSARKGFNIMISDDEVVSHQTSEQLLSQTESEIADDVENPEDQTQSPLLQHKLLTRPPLNKDVFLKSAASCADSEHFRVKL